MVLNLPCAKRWLVDMPAELRLMVYKHYFQSLNFRLHSDQKQACREHASRLPFLTLTRAGPARLGILLTSKVVNIEAMPIFFDEARFVIDSCPCWKPVWKKQRTNNGNFGPQSGLLTFAPAMLNIKNLCFREDKYVYRSNTQWLIRTLRDTGLELRSLIFTTGFILSRDFGEYYACRSKS